MNPFLTDPTIEPYEPSAEYAKLIIDELMADILNEAKRDAIEQIKAQLRDDQ